MFERLRYRRQRRAYRQMLAKWNSDGGDDRFRFDYPLPSDAVVLDVGGYQGQWAVELYRRHRCRIHIFEPIAEYADRIIEQVAGNSDFRVHAFALGANTRQETMSIAGAGSSAHKTRRSKVQVEFRDVKDWFEANSIADVALMKINIEGGEYELLERLLDADLAQQIAAFQIQFHYFVRNAEERMEKIQDRLSLTHSLTWQYRFIWENWERKKSGV